MRTLAARARVGRLVRHGSMFMTAALLTSCGDNGDGSGGSTAPSVAPPEIGVLVTQPLPSLPTATLASTLPPTTLPPDPLACVGDLPLRTRVAQLVWPSTEAVSFGDDAIRFAEWGVGGAVVLTYDDGLDPRALHSMKAAGAIPMLLAANEEGGQLQPFHEVAKLPPAETVEEEMKPDEAKAMIREHGLRLKELGIDIVFGPVTDVGPKNSEEEGPVGNRSFGRDVLVVGAYARAYAEGWIDAGLLPVLKHFPGQGDANADPHRRKAKTPIVAKLRTRDLLPYEEMQPLGAGVMVGHLDVPDLTDTEDGGNLPASLNNVVITELLRGELHYDEALVFTDALGMGAIASRFTIPQAAELAIIAGADVALFNDADETPEVIDRLLEAISEERLTEQRLNESVSRVLQAKKLDACDL